MIISLLAILFGSFYLIGSKRKTMMGQNRAILQRNDTDVSLAS